MPIICNGTQGGFILETVTQFTFITNDTQLACILRDLANVDGLLGAPQVNLRAILQLRLKNGCTLFKFVPGLAQPVGQNNADLINTRRVLNNYCVSYREDTVVAVQTTGAINDLAVIQAVFNLSCVHILASYAERFCTEGTAAQIYEVDDLALVIQALCGFTFEELEEQAALLTGCDELQNCVCGQPIDCGKNDCNPCADKKHHKKHDCGCKH